MNQLSSQAPCLSTLLSAKILIACTYIDTQTHKTRRITFAPPSFTDWCNNLLLSCTKLQLTYVAILIINAGNIGEFDTFESGGDTYLMCITESDAVKAIEANKRGGLWQNFGGDGGIPTSHASFGCASAINYARPLSPCYYTELMDAYAQVAVTSMSAPKADTASAKHTLKIRFNMLDLAAVPDPFADEFCSERYA